MSNPVVAADGLLLTRILSNKFDTHKLPNTAITKGSCSTTSEGKNGVCFYHFPLLSGL